MRSIDHFSCMELADLLNRCWMTHDGMWFFHCLQESGIESANRMNRSAIKSLAPIEIKRIRRALGIERDIEGYDEFRRFFKGAADFVIPAFMNVRWGFPEDGKMTWAFDPGACFAFKGISRMGVIDGYECGVLYRVACWIDALGIRSEFEPGIGRCHMHFTGACTGEIRLDF